MNAEIHPVQLIVKLQLRSFEPGEFIEETPRTIDQTLALIEQFPWAEERKGIVISLTNPSVAIQGRNNDYLKLAPYYNGKYVLYYFDHAQRLFTRSAIDYKQLFPFVKDFFAASPFTPIGFKKEPTPFQHNRIHFETADFHYTLTPERIRKFLLSTSGINFILSLFLLPYLFINHRAGISIIEILILCLAIFFMGGGLNLWLFFGYYKNARGKLLVMSRGNPTFYFGEKENPFKYDKSDIIRIVTEKIQSSRHPANGFAVVTLEMKNSPNIDLPNLLIDDSSLKNKLPGIPKTEINGIPFLH